MITNNALLPAPTNAASTLANAKASSIFTFYLPYFKILLKNMLGQ